ncbi:hypothetical protein AHAS_Ahas09G0162800 [Arachis hypogaea]
MQRRENLARGCRCCSRGSFLPSPPSPLETVLAASKASIVAVGLLRRRAFNVATIHPLKGISLPRSAAMKPSCLAAKGSVTVVPCLCHC